MERENSHKPPSPSSPPLPPSLASSPSHDFSFTISLHPLISSPFNLKQEPAASAVAAADFDLSPADDIFFHGHLLPLHFLSHRPSNAFIETTTKNADSSSTKPTLIEPAAASSDDKEFDKRPKARPFSSFFPLRNWLPKTEDRAAEKQRNKKKVLFGRLWKKYAGFMEPLLFFKGMMKEKREFRQSPYSFSAGDFNPREGGWRRRWRGDFSAPASMRTSPANSGLLVAPSSSSSSNALYSSSSDESTMEELQNAIQAAIAHCKNSVAVKEDGCGR